MKSSSRTRRFGDLTRPILETHFVWKNTTCCLRLHVHFSMLSCCSVRSLLFITAKMIKLASRCNFKWCTKTSKSKCMSHMLFPVDAGDGGGPRFDLTFHRENMRKSCCLRLHVHFSMLSCCSVRSLLFITAKMIKLASRCNFKWCTKTSKSKCMSHMLFPHNSQGQRN